MERFFDRVVDPPWDTSAIMDDGAWAPMLDVFETKDAMIVTAERRYGTFLRSVRLPMAVDGSKITATFKNGVLVVTLPKTPASRGTKIPVKAE